MATITDTFKDLIANDRKFIETLFVVENKARQVIPFRYNDIQNDVDQTETGRDIWVKPAQVGFSTERIAKRYQISTLIPEATLYICPLVLAPHLSLQFQANIFASTTSDT